MPNIEGTAASCLTLLKADRPRVFLSPGAASALGFLRSRKRDTATLESLMVTRPTRDNRGSRVPNSSAPGDLAALAGTQRLGPQWVIVDVPESSLSMARTIRSALCTNGFPGTWTEFVTARSARRQLSGGPGKPRVMATAGVASPSPEVASGACGTGLRDGAPMRYYPVPRGGR
jgi:hypothetical protein